MLALERRVPVDKKPGPCLKDSAFEFDFPTSELQVLVTGSILYGKQSRFQLWAYSALLAECFYAVIKEM